MHQRAETFCENAHERYGIELDVVEFPEGTKTAADAAAAVGCEVAQIASSIVLAVDDELIVAVTSGANRVDMDAVASKFDAPGSSVSMADPDRIKSVVGWSIGGVPPLCHETDVPTLFDPTLLTYETVYGAAGTPNAVFPIDPEALRSLADAEAVDVTE
ncbi:YbaK/EbsC family protein [Natronocalculus amylovorans]|uniref:YbaK/EbsC family protein n=1 Tax=Natronocalculus amylovorans TaxID=2917812 RepID=A0AAE3K8V0_9EURY|nr:YbaK/EbsC family protein [Natronocalculus amylovorans]MCL9817423.1 YbaK/EbsC family protein [Natronocalculus amylovorans]NUE02552.1 YbaK/EbsC family protein [Halorubraceae archaeon YAN]